MCNKYNLLDDFLLKKIELLRKKRNPFTHIKPYEYEFTLSQRIQKELKEPICMLEKDAEDALTLMYQILITRLSAIKNT